MNVLIDHAHGHLKVATDSMCRMEVCGEPHEVKELKGYLHVERKVRVQNDVVLRDERFPAFELPAELPCQDAASQASQRCALLRITVTSTTMRRKAVQLLPVQYNRTNTYEKQTHWLQEGNTGRRSYSTGNGVGQIA